MRIGKIIGATTWRKRWKNEQPSTLAASRISTGTDVKPASSTMAENGNVRHTFTKMHAINASLGSPSQIGQPSVPNCPINPMRLSTQLMTLNCESYIHFQDSTLIAIGSVKGMTTRPRMIFLPLKFCSSRNASDVPSRLLSTAATTRKMTLLRKASQKSSISHAARKFSRPMKWAMGSPTLASLTAR